MPVLTTLHRLILGALFFISPTVWAQQDLPLRLPYSAVNTAAPLPGAPTVSETGADIYLVENIAADVTANSAAAARDRAIFDAQRAALGQLLTRLGADQGVDIGAIPNNKLAGMVQDFEITQEKASTVRYIATLNVRFKPTAVQNFLNGSGVSYTTTPSKPVVILPVSTSNGRAVLWEERTAWRAACESLVRPDPILPYIVPAGDLADVGAISANDALAGNDSAFNNVAANYNAGTIVVAQIAAAVEKLNPARSLAVSVSRYDETGQRLSSDLINLPPAPTLEAQFDAAAQAVDKLIRKYWREGSGLGGGNDGISGYAPVIDGSAPQAAAPSSLPVEAPIASLTDLATLRQKLSVIEPIHTTQIVSLTRGMALLRLGYNGDIIRLQQALAGQNLVLVQLPAGNWQLRSR